MLYLKQKLVLEFGHGVVGTTFPSIEVLYQKTTDKLKCAYACSKTSGPGAESPCIGATVSFFNVCVAGQSGIPRKVTTALNIIKSALKCMVPKEYS